MNSNPASKLTPEELLSKIHTGNLLDNLETATQAEVLDLRYTKLSYQKNLIQKELTYTQQLLDPRWKAKRNLILQRDNFSCTVCSSTQNLNVHHIKYTGQAWEAPDKDLITVCNSCHMSIHKSINPVDTVIICNNALIKATKEAITTLPTLNIFIANVSEENFVYMWPDRVSKLLKISKITTANHIKKLKQQQIIIPDESEPNLEYGVRCWRICPYLVWKGKADTLIGYLNNLKPDHVWKTYNDPVVCS